MSFLFKQVIFRFHVKFQGCIQYKWVKSSNVLILQASNINWRGLLLAAALRVGQSPKNSWTVVISAKWRFFNIWIFLDGLLTVTHFGRWSP